VQSIFQSQLHFNSCFHPNYPSFQSVTNHSKPALPSIRKHSTFIRILADITEIVHPGLPKYPFLFGFLNPFVKGLGV